MKINKKFVGVRLKPSTIDKLEKFATCKELCLSELIRLILEDYVERNC